MAESPPHPDSYDDTGGHGPTTATPRWVKVFGIIALVLILLVGVLLLTGGGNHGPGRHTPSGEAGGHTP